MPFDEPEQRVFDLLERPLDAFRSALASTIEELRGRIEDRTRMDGRQQDEEGADLGSFALGRIDADRFASIIAEEAVAVEPAAVDRMEQAFETLTELAARKNRLFRVNVEPGASLPHAVAGQVTEVGRAFGASRVVELARTGRYRTDEHGLWLASFGFANWNGPERALAPVLVVRVNGEDLHAEGLSELLDGAQKIVLLVRGDCPPAPLVRLITPGLFVAQVGDESSLEALAAWNGPGIAAVVPEAAARFVHDPAGGATLAERLTVAHIPVELPARALGTLSVRQLTEPLAQLKALAACGATPGAPGADAPDQDAAGKLAAWLLSQTDLDDLA